MYPLLNHFYVEHKPLQQLQEGKNLHSLHLLTNLGDPELYLPNSFKSFDSPFTFAFVETSPRGLIADSLTPIRKEGCYKFETSGCPSVGPRPRSSAIAEMLRFECGRKLIVLKSSMDGDAETHAVGSMFR